MTFSDKERRELARRVQILTVDTEVISIALRKIVSQLNGDLPVFPDEPTYLFSNLPTSLPIVKNGNFSQRNWTDITMPGGQSRGQQPDGWKLIWQIPGQRLIGDPDTTITVEPECVHKLSDQLPTNEQKDGLDALILEGDAVYKIFHSAGIFYAELYKTVFVPPGDGEIIAFVQVHKSSSDPWAAEAGLWANDVGGWYNGTTIPKLEDHKWIKMRASYEMPSNGGNVEIVIRVKSKWALPVDFFIDDVKIKVF